MLFNNECMTETETRFRKKYFKTARNAECIEWDLLCKLLALARLDRYIDRRIDTDKTLIGILKDIQGNLQQIADRTPDPV